MRSADVVMHNVRPAGSRRLGIDEDSLRGVQPEHRVRPFVRLRGRRTVVVAVGVRPDRFAFVRLGTRHRRTGSTARVAADVGDGLPRRSRVLRVVAFGLLQRQRTGTAGASPRRCSRWLRRARARRSSARRPPARQLSRGGYRADGYRPVASDLPGACTAGSRCRWRRTRSVPR